MKLHSIEQIGLHYRVMILFCAQEAEKKMARTWARKWAYLGQEMGMLIMLEALRSCNDLQERCNNNNHDNSADVVQALENSSFSW
jgi:hypothetical protein